MMGGEIGVESELGKGARFVFTFKAGVCEKPRGDLADTDGAAHDSAEGGLRSGEFAGRRMLLAEDVDVNREIMQFLLEDSGLEIDCAENGQEALDMVAADPGRYDVVFMDMQMPIMDGCEATRRIRALPDPEASKLPIIAMTANVFREDVETCLEAGMDDHVGKPVNIDDIYKKLRKHLN
jgi:CheY-like chemotaxis protein